MRTGKVPRVTCPRCGRSLAVSAIHDVQPQPRDHFCDHRVHCTSASLCCECAVMRAQKDSAA